MKDGEDAAGRTGGGEAHGRGPADRAAAAADQAASLAEEAAGHPVVEGGARLGYGVSGLLHLLMGLLALRLALGDPSAEADQSGALGALAPSPAGGVLLVLCAVGLGLLALWQLALVLRRRPVGGRAKAAAKAVLYLAMAGGAIGALRGTATSSARQTQDATGWLLSLPFGPVAVGAVGLGIAGAGAYHVVKGATRRFRRDLVEQPARAVVIAAMIGYVAKGLALVVVGALFIEAARTHDPAKSTGLNGALETLLSAPAGPALVIAIGVGFAAYGVYSFARARYART